MINSKNIGRFALRLTTLVVLLSLALPVGAADKPYVVFANPAAKGDAFFQRMTDFMQAAADDLGFELEVYYGNRNHVQIDENIRTIFKKKRLPDYLIGMNARESGQTTLMLAEQHKVKTVFINQSFIGEERKAVGGPGEKYKQWLFEFLPDDVHSGYQLAMTLLEEAKIRGLGGMGRPIHVFGISGHMASSASALREEGLKKAIEDTPGVVLDQVVHADWKEEKARELATRSLLRHSEISVIWAASDVMARGAAEGGRRMGRIPGRDILTGGVDWADFALDKVEDGSFTATVGGHFMDGAWALVMLYDYINGVDVPKSSTSTFSSIVRGNVGDYRGHFGAGEWNKIDFRKYSKHLNPELKAYDFGLESVLRQVR